ncbi:hypothetical protein ENBRE01_1957 [Enteropsectra breve]|nr:hypothetical protein ENBRE01_1957 [Enteropsectra breve]
MSSDKITDNTESLESDLESVRSVQKKKHHKKNEEPLDNFENIYRNLNAEDLKSEIPIFEDSKIIPKDANTIKINLKDSSSAQSSPIIDEKEELMFEGKIENLNSHEKTRLLNLVNNYKNEYKSFMIGSINSHCRKSCRETGDKWYEWTQKNIEHIDKYQEQMRSLISRYGHGQLQKLCMENGGDSWNLTVEERAKKVVKELKHMDKLIRSKGGMKTKWGKIKYGNGPFDRMSKSEASKIAKAKNSADINLIDYVEYKRKRWETHYTFISEKEELHKNDKNL